MPPSAVGFTRHLLNNDGGKRRFQRVDDAVYLDTQKIERGDDTGANHAARDRILNRG